MQTKMYKFSKTCFFKKSCKMATLFSSQVFSVKIVKVFLHISQDLVSEQVGCLVQRK